METKLDAGQKHMLKLVMNGADKDGWAPVSPQVLPLFSKLMPSDLVTLEAVGSDGRGRVRLTVEGSNLMAAMAWL